MQPQLYLHIGDCKTGSTVLQSMLARQDCQPEALRLFYPGKMAHGALAQSLGPRRKDLYPQRWTRIARRLGKVDWDIAVLSSELFEFIPPAAVAQAIRDHLPDHAEWVKVIVYVRPHTARAVSQFSENLKLGHDTGDFAAFLDRFLAAGRLNYSDRLARWQEAFGDRLIVRPYLRSWFPDGDVRKDFLAQILPAGTAYSLADGQDDNSALSVGDLALMRMLQKRFQLMPGVDPENGVAFGKQFGRLLRDIPPPTPGERLRLPHSLYDRIRTECRQDAEQLDRFWVNGPCFVPALTAAEAETVSTAQSLECGDYHSPETIRLMQVWADLLVRQMTDPAADFIPRMRAPE